MNGLFKKIILLPAMILSVAAFALTGCAGSDEEESHNGVVSYISTQTAVYSSTAEVVESVADSVVEIRTESIVTRWGRQYIVSGAGSGVIVGVNEDVYYVVTNNHVIDGANDITVTTRSGEGFEAEIVAADDSADIAVVVVKSETSLSVAVWGDSDGLKIGEDLIAIGNPLGSLGGTVTKGILSAKGRSIAVGDFYMTLLQTDTAINPGNSGGGLFNMRGELIGVVNAKTTDEEIEGICFAIPGNSARNVFSDLVEYGYLRGRATFNLGLAELTNNAQSQTIVYVTSAEGAAEGTFMQYDRIYSVNGTQVSTVLEFNTVMSRLSPGDSVRVEVYRGRLTQGFWGDTYSFDSEITSFTVRAVQYGA